MDACVGPNPPPLSWFEASKALNAVTLSPCGTRAVIGGRDILQLVSLNNNKLEKGITFPSTKRANLNHSAVDVKWRPVSSPNLLATAATNGAVVVWDLDRISAGSKVGAESTFKEHSRTTNRLCWHSKDPDLLLSGSQDATVKLWDIREKDKAPLTFEPCSESVRDVQFDPHNPNHFAAAFENGTVQVWDIRGTSPGAVTTISAHVGIALTVQFHPTWKNILASGGRDKRVNIWNLDAPSFTKPRNTVQTFDSIGKVSWRSDHSTQVATAANVLDNEVHVWDINRPFIPLLSFKGHRDVVTGFHWLNEGSLLTVSKDKFVILHSCADAFRPQTTLPPAAVAVSSTEIAWVIDQVDRTSSPSQFASRKPTGLIQVLDETCEVPDSDIRRTSHTSLPQHEITPVVPIDDIAPMLMDPPYPIYKFLAQQYKLHGTLPSAICRHNAMVAAAAGCIERQHTWMVLSNLCSLPKLQPSTVSLLSPTAGATLEVTADAFDASVDGEEAVLTAPAGSEPLPTSVVERLGHAGLSQGLLLLLDSVNLEGRSKAFTLLPVDDAESSSSGIESFDESDSGGSIQSGYTGMSQASEIVSTLFPTGSFPLVSAPSDVDTSVGEREAAQSTVMPRDVEEVVDSPGKVTSEFVFRDATSAFLEDSTNHTIRLRKQAIADMLKHYSDRGDVQMCATVLCALKGSPLFPEPARPNQHILWTRGYIDLLHRLQLWGPASAIIARSNMPDVNRLNKVNTEYSRTCTSCKLVDQRDPRCRSCYISQMCAICQLPVKGLYVWCQGCGHGGHLEHIKEWFATESSCPTGCGHNCNLTGRHNVTGNGAPNV